MPEAYIVAMTRSAFTKAKKGAFQFTRSDDLAVSIIKSLLQTLPQLHSEDIDDVIVGCANPEGEQGFQIGRQISLRALGKSTPGMTINRYCASGLEAIAIATAKIRANMGHCFVAGGVESMSLVPMEGYKIAPSYELASQHPDYLVGMGLTAEAVSVKYGISRLEQDEFAFRSHQLAAKSQQKNYFKEEITPVNIEESLFYEGKKIRKTLRVELDEGIRRDTSLEQLSDLKPVFAKEGTVTAGNSSQTTDGVAFHVVISESMLRKLELQPLGRIVSCSVAGVDPLYMGIGPCDAIPKALTQAGISLKDISVIELNEAFAAQSLAVMKLAELDPQIVNPNGGAIALGHPLGCSGARLTMSAINELQRRNKSYGLVTACVGGGQGIAAVVESFPKN